jgi:hypothetical protein
MAITAKKLFGGTLLTTSAATLYTAPAATTVRLTELMLSNGTTLDVTATVHLVASGSAASTVNKIVPGVSIGGNQLVQLQFNSVMATGDFISALASSANGIVAYGSGAELTTA